MTTLLALRREVRSLAQTRDMTVATTGLRCHEDRYMAALAAACPDKGAYQPWPFAFQIIREVVDLQSFMYHPLISTTGSFSANAIHEFETTTVARAI